MNSTTRSDHQFPVAAAQVSARQASGLPCERRVGQHVGRGIDDEAFESFGRHIQERARSVLTPGLRLLTLPHLKNSIAIQLKGLPQASRVLIDGYIFEMLKTSVVRRLPTISRSMKSYQAIYWPDGLKTVGGVLKVIRRSLATKGYTTLSEIKESVASGVITRDQYVEMLFGHLLYLGEASTDIAPDCPIDAIRLPYAPPRL